MALSTANAASITVNVMAKTGTDALSGAEWTSGPEWCMQTRTCTDIIVEEAFIKLLYIIHIDYLILDIQWLPSKHSTPHHVYNFGMYVWLCGILASHLLFLFVLSAHHMTHCILPCCMGWQWCCTLCQAQVRSPQMMRCLSAWNGPQY